LPCNGFSPDRLPLLFLLAAMAFQQAAATGSSPEDFLLVSNEVDGLYCRDFSVLLGRLDCEWLVLDGDGLPEQARRGNLVIIGGLDSIHTGELMEDLLSGEETGDTGPGQAVTQVENPWDENGTIHLCTGSDPSRFRAAAEEAVYSIMAGADPGEWIRTSIPFASRADAREFVEGMQHLPGEELPAEEMAMDVGARTRSGVSREEAAEDVEYLFYLLSHGYCGYRYFSALGDFEEAKRAIMEDLGAGDRWSTSDLFEMVRGHLSFIRDLHLVVGGVQYGDHLDFWHDPGIEVSAVGDIYRFEADGDTHDLLSVNGENPGEFLFPSLNADGEAVYRLGTLSPTPPESLRLLTRTSGGEGAMVVELDLSEYHPDGVFREERMGGIPVIRAHSFGDSHTDILSDFVSTAQEYRGEPYVIIDVRGNGGGNCAWPSRWVSSFTGVRPSFNMVWTEMVTSTTMMGRINYFDHILENIGGIDRDWYESQRAIFQARVDSFESGSREPYWEPQNIPDAGLIPNPTTIVVVMDGEVASAGEGLLSYLSGVQNVVLVGENSAGALTFGQNTYHRLPNSNALVRMPISLNVFMDLEIREEDGFSPDLWVPAADALNYAVAAVRAGTISTSVEIPGGYFDREFVPEKTTRGRVEVGRLLPYITIVCISVFLGNIVYRVAKRLR